MRANLIEINRHLSDNGYEITADINENGMYRCDIYEKGIFFNQSKKEFKTWELAQETTAKEMFNWFISQQKK